MFLQDTRELYFQIQILRKVLVRTQPEGGCLKARERERSPDHQLADTLIWAFQLPELWENKILFLKPLSVKYFLWQPKQTIIGPIALLYSSKVVVALGNWHWQLAWVIHTFIWICIQAKQCFWRPHLHQMALPPVVGFDVCWPESPSGLKDVCLQKLEEC